MDDFDSVACSDLITLATDPPLTTALSLIDSLQSLFWCFYFYITSAFSKNQNW